jgi:hypothetical protein
MTIRREDDRRRPIDIIKIKDFGGFMPNSDPHDVPPGVAISQVNATSVRPGELRVRLGFAVVRFDS